ncbi:hypothetical protein [Kitasatospora sp. NPDC056181]|uniref:hypothetical protein n=1 Tax=Kitasatospora sp. NPDC056181 TaxID=3345737 RepID=UPI0035DB0E73
MSGTVIYINRAPAGSAAEHDQARLIMQGDGRPVAHHAPDGNRSDRYATRASSTGGCDTKAVRRAVGRLHGRIAGPGSTESPHVVRPVPENH